MLAWIVHGQMAVVHPGDHARSLDMYGAQTLSLPELRSEEIVVLSNFNGAAFLHNQGQGGHLGVREAVSNPLTNIGSACGDDRDSRSSFP